MHYLILCVLSLLLCSIMSPGTCCFWALIILLTQPFMSGSLMSKLLYNYPVGCVGMRQIFLAWLYPIHYYSAVCTQDTSRTWSCAFHLKRPNKERLPITGWIQMNSDLIQLKSSELFGGGGIWIWHWRLGPEPDRDLGTFPFLSSCVCTSPAMPLLTVVKYEFLSI